MGKCLNENRMVTFKHDPPQEPMAEKEIRDFIDSLPTWKLGYWEAKNNGKS